MNKIRIGQVGTAHGHAAGKMAVFRRSPDYEVVGIVETDPKRKARAQEQDVYKDLKWMSQDELLNFPDLEAVAVETEVRDLLDVAESCVSADKHIHLDKPAGSSLPQFKHIVDEAARKHLVVQMGYMYRYNPAIVLLRDFLQKGWLGEPFELHAVMSKVISPAARRPLAGYPGGMMFELGCHLIDLVVGILGPPEEVIPFTQRAGHHDDELLDNMLAVFRYDGALASVKSSCLEVEGFERRHLALCGTEGTIHVQPLDEPDLQVAFSKDRGSYGRAYQEIKIGDYARYVADAADMARIIRGEKDADYSYEHDFQVQETVLRACGLPLS